MAVYGRFIDTSAGKGVQGTGGDDGGLPVWLEDGGKAAQGRGAAVPGRCCAGRAGTAA